MTTSCSPPPVAPVEQEQMGAPVQKLQEQVQLPFPLHDPREQFALQLGRSCA
ncbi:hypothetical protein [Longimicrobium terrae]|uniref:Uncharacterized protein n=1 Tax=Longimicrobium terrae TaxID=1639882 RepID=A0A841H164_9BACT|nr:hypothetical protein [Longimicrobium terrae]MBB4637298.1 hypothetical protein [Longimicrobium terrae]MBB6071696.1 hypothetical protein [Longimicrobium terrae]NNC28457.1 hypothetical protein [Longimicrobium terrae]